MEENNQTVTNEELARMIAKGFEGVDDRFKTAPTKDEMDQRFNRMLDVFATKDEMHDVKEGLGALEQNVQNLTISIDRLAKAVDDLRIEYSAIAMQMNRHEKWIQQLAQKLDFKLEF
jgi:archaellum component FlaC